MLIGVQKAVVAVARVDFLPAGSVGAVRVVAVVRRHGRVGLDEVSVRLGVASVNQQQPREGLQRARI